MESRDQNKEHQKRGWRAKLFGSVFRFVIGMEKKSAT